MSKDGDYLIDPDRAKNVKLSYAGASIIYTNKKKRYADSLVITGPTTAKLNIMVRISLCVFNSQHYLLLKRFL